MADTKLQSFNVFLTQRLTAAAMEIFGFVEKTIVEYHEEVYRAKQDSQRLQGLLDLVYKPQIKLQRAGTNQLKSPVSTKEASLQHCELELIPSVVPEQPGLLLHLKQEPEEFWSSSEEQPHTPIGYHDQDLHYSGPVEHSDEGNDSNELHERGQQADVLPLELDDDPEPTSLPEANCSDAMKKRFVFRCSICNDQFSGKMQLKWHLQAHSSNKGIHCYICGMTVASKSELERHMRVHSGERPYACTVCGNRYKWKSHIKEHMRTHTGERPYTCYICGRSFFRGTTMSKHARITHNEYKPFKCVQCGQCFPMQLLMKQHIKKVHEVNIMV